MIVSIWNAVESVLNNLAEFMGAKEPSLLFSVRQSYEETDGSLIIRRLVPPSSLVCSFARIYHLICVFIGQMCLVTGRSESKLKKSAQTFLYVVKLSCVCVFELQGEEYKMLLEWLWLNLVKKNKPSGVFQRGSSVSVCGVEMTHEDLNDCNWSSIERGSFVLFDRQ